MPNLPQIIDARMMEVLLRKRYQHQSDDTCCEHEAVAAVLDGRGSEVLLQEADAHLEACAECRRAFTVVSSLVASGAISKPAPVRYAVTKGLDLVQLWRQNWLAFAGAAAALLLVVGTFSYFWSPTPGQTVPSSEMLVRKGKQDELAVAVDRGGKQFTLRPFDRIETGDRLGFFYSAMEPGFLALVTVDSDGNTAALVTTPENRAVDIEAAADRPLDDGAVVRSGEGCEWLVAVFADRSFTEGDLLAALEGARFDNQTCGSFVDIEWARSVVVVPLRR